MKDTTQEQEAVARLIGEIKTLPKDNFMLLITNKDDVSLWVDSEALLALVTAYERQREEHSNLTMLVRRLVCSRYLDDCQLKEQATDYLTRKGLWGSVLRNGLNANDENAAPTPTQHSGGEQTES